MDDFGSVSLKRASHLLSEKQSAPGEERSSNCIIISFDSALHLTPDLSPLDTDDFLSCQPQSNYEEDIGEFAIDPMIVPRWSNGPNLFGSALGVVRYKSSMSSRDKSGVRWREASREMMMQLEDRSSPGADCFSDNKCEARFNDTLPKSSITFV
ncbi:hypothetical protein TNIN_165771 [Trichonephila inaurata madagascariensis]|uniref:Uncharacterized protein n=1 Tax=Trichonephila inaurata madagascariensis TaxID=2747483 RepID=A0A8X7CEQ7_9ARAC|nr:hypothetical protein TNIN_165771 [Trichonephila inaurata madagascariensis]